MNSFLSQLLFNPADGDTFGTIFHVLTLSALSISVWEILDLKEKLFRPAASSLGLMDSRPPVRTVRTVSPTRRLSGGGM